MNDYRWDEYRFTLKIVRTSCLRFEVFLTLSNNKISCIKSSWRNIIQVDLYDAITVYV